MPTSHPVAVSKATPSRSELEYGLYEIARHNATEAQDHNEYGESFLHSMPAAYQGSEAIGLGVHAPEQDQGLCSYDAYDAYAYQEVMHTPPTPRSNAASDKSRRTRSGRVIKRTDSPMSVRSRVSKSPAPKKSRAKEKKKTHVLSAPLSELTKDSKIPVRDMEAHIERGVDGRTKDLEKYKGKIPRPMNAFILYRSAYAERCKEWCMQNNHQVVSSVSGASWAMEPQSLKDYYNELSKTERDRHAEAFPTYKFSPSKPASVRKVEAEDDDEEDVLSERDPDGEYAPSRRQARQTKKQVPQAARYETPYVQTPYGYAPVSNMDQWSFESSARPLPAAYQQVAPYPGQYAQNAAQHNQYYSSAEDARLRMNTTPVQSYTGQALVSLPGGQHHELLQTRTQTPVSVYQQPQMGGNYVGQNGMLYPGQTMQRADTVYSLAHGQESHFDEAFGGDFLNGAMGPSAGGHQDWQLDPALAGPFDEYSQYLDQ